MTTKHTPGPWETSVLSDGTQWQVCEEGAGDWIADCKTADNASLIAAAPELLAALEDAVNEIRRLYAVHGSHYAGKIGEPDIAVVDKARAVLARAKGQA